MTYHIKRGEILKYKKQYLQVNPHLHNGLLPEYMLIAFDNSLPPDGVSLDYAFEWFLQHHISKKHGRSIPSYRCNFRRFFLWIADTVGEHFKDCTDTEGCTIHYSLHDGILEWR